MEASYLDRRRPKYLVIVLPILVIALLVGGVIFWLKNRQSIISPVPPTPSFEVIFMTPTPEPVSPTATPSATLKTSEGATSTPRPTSTDTPTPMSGGDTPTEKPSPSDTPTP